ncbi:MAG TPA: NAD-dependent succinate-semialdehyde dehydrogenase [Corynebacterium kroppenstedtii]|nr:NAD-dependent succinate-semialdehyde dehydrogenase [Corynebacterium kroppenstedtii]
MTINLKGVVVSIDPKNLIEETPTQLFINGKWVNSSSSETFDVENPATGEVIATVASATGDDAIKALDAASDAQYEWSHTSSRERSSILKKAFDLVQENSEELATLMTLEMGKPLAESRGEVTYGGEFLRWFSEEANRIGGQYSTSPEGTLRFLVSRRPVGPCFLITPWNFPLAMGTRKIGPALAAGCTVVLKPARLTPLTSLYFIELLRQAGVPDGVVNVVPSKSASSVSEPIMDDSRLRKMSFTGSTGVGKHLLEAASKNVLRTSMELGGNAPFVVFDDADLDKAVEGAMAAKMRNMGEACTAANRFIVHESVAEEFSKKLAEAMGDLTCGNGLDEGTTCGPLIEKKALDNVAALVDDAKEKGAKVLCGGELLEGKGYFYKPTVLYSVPTDARVFGEEIFGPVAPITTFSTESQALELANDTEYGLSSYLFTTNVQRALRFSEDLEAGMAGLNVGVLSNAAAPFGGVKQSGLGREGGNAGIEEYQEVRYIAMPTE